MAHTSSELDSIRRCLTEVAGLPVPLWRTTTTDDIGNATADTSGWLEVTLPDRFAARPAGWYRTTVVVPERHLGWPSQGAPLVLKWSARSWAEVYVNGRYLGRHHGELGTVTLTESAAPGERFEVALRVVGKAIESESEVESAGGSGRLPGLFSAHLEFGALDEARPKIRALLEHIDVCEQLIGLSGQGGYVLDQAASAIDRNAIDAGDTAALLRSIEDSHEALKGLDDLFKRYTISLTANAHIDMAWLWDVEETKQVCHDTFRSVLNLMNEYPDFVFAHSQAQSYMWVEQLWPDMFEEIRARVAEGRWEIVGGMWVEPDCNLPSGESFVRQVVYGKRYFREKFGVDVTLGWNPDSFGYNWSMPQVYKKCGIDAFLTQKLTWNDTNVWPHRAFWWESPDGSRIFSYFPTGYVGFVESNGLIADLVTFSKATGYQRTDHLYGLGDHGGGPSREMLDRAGKLSSLSPYPRVQHQKARDFIDTLIAEIGPDKKVPVWASELYLEYHRGTFTSQAKIKKGNREAERLLRRLEACSVAASRKGLSYPSAGLAGLWQKTLFNQFHDILPGSCIGAAAEDAWADYAAIQSDGGALLDKALEAIVGDGPGIAVFNALNYPRGGVVAVAAASLSAPFGAPVSVTGPDGAVVPSQWVREDDGEHLLFRAGSVPALGYAVYTVSPKAEAAEAAVWAAEGVLENDLVRVEVAGDGTFRSVYDKANGREALARGEAGNVLQVFVDKPEKWDAWEIDAGFEADVTELRDPVEAEVLESGPVRARIRTKRTWGSSTFVQDIMLYAGSPRIDIRTRVDWQERQKMLKVLFPVDVYAPEATYEIPFAAIARSTGNETSVEKAQFEVPALQWADLSAGGYGVSLLNDCKHGHDIKGNRMRLTLLRSPISPDPNCDRGEHVFTYSLFPHAGDWRKGGTYRAAFELNDPLFTRPAAVRGAVGFLEIGPENVLVSAVKKAEDSDDVIVRFFETAGADTTATLRFAEPPEAAWETDMMENDLAAVPVSGTTVECALGHNEVKTLKVRFPAGVS